jgi:AcrR family transcriptional regulator
MADGTGQKKQRAQLSAEGIVEAALDVVEAEGLAAFSIRKLGQKLGCEAMSIYHHFPSKAHLMDAMVDRSVGGMANPPEEITFREKLEFVAREIRRIGMERPAFFRFLGLHRMNTPEGLAMLNRSLGIFRQAGFSPENAAHYFRTFSYYVVGAVLDETNGYSMGPTSVQVVTAEYMDAHAPFVRDAGPFFQSRHWDRIFDLGLQMMLDGIVAARPDP